MPLRQAFLLFWLPLQAALAAPLDDALELVMSQSAVVQAKNRVMGVVGGARDLKGTVSLATGYAEKQTDEFAGGFDARTRFTVEYPIFGGTAKATNDQDKARALNDLYIAEEQLRNQFITDIQNVALLERTARGLIQTHALKVDRLKAAKQANDRATEADEQIDLWSFIEAAKQAEDAAFQADQKFLIELERVSRSYGKEEHERLRQLIGAHVQQTGAPLKAALTPPSALGTEEQP